jgi:hypothetical protein
MSLAQANHYGFVGKKPSANYRHSICLGTDEMLNPRGTLAQRDPLSNETESPILAVISTDNVDPDGIGIHLA